MRALALLVVFIAPSVSCASSLPHPPYSSQATTALSRIDFGPPPGRIELIPKRPTAADAWVDGEWIRRHGRWYWLVGRWVKTPPRWTFAPWVVVRAADGSPFYAPSVWKDAAGIASPAPAALAYATVSAEAVFNPQNEVEQTGRNIKTAPAPPIVPQTENTTADGSKQAPPDMAADTVKPSVPKP